MALQRQIRIKREGGTVTFDPPDLDANVGDQIFWTNDDDQAHWPGLSGNDTFFMPNQIAPQSTSPIFSPGAAAQYDYVCSLHPGETGKITIT